MPKVTMNGKVKHFPYTKKGIEKAEEAMEKAMKAKKNVIKKKYAKKR